MKGYTVKRRRSRDTRDSPPSAKRSRCDVSSTLTPTSPPISSTSQQYADESLSNLIEQQLSSTVRNVRLEIQRRELVQYTARLADQQSMSRVDNDAKLSASAPPANELETTAPETQKQVAAAPRPWSIPSNGSPRRCTNPNCKSQKDVLAEVNGTPACLLCAVYWAYEGEWRDRALIHAWRQDKLIQNAAFVTCSNPNCRVNIAPHPRFCFNQDNRGGSGRQIYKTRGLVFCYPCGRYSRERRGEMKPSASHLAAPPRSIDWACQNPNCTWTNVMIPEAEKQKSQRHFVKGQLACKSCFTWSTKHDGGWRPRGKCMWFTRSDILNRLAASPVLPTDLDSTDD